MIAHSVIFGRLRDRIRLQLTQILEYLSRSSAEGSKSTALAPLHWMLGLSLSGLLGAIQLDAPERVVDPLVILVVVAFVAELLAYGYFLFTGNTDALRSERFTIKKMQIERGLLGDSLSGFVEVSRPDRSKALPPSDQPRLGGER